MLISPYLTGEPFFIGDQLRHAIVGSPVFVKELRVCRQSLRLLGLDGDVAREYAALIKFERHGHRHC